MFKASFGVDYRLRNDSRIDAYVTYEKADYDNPAFDAERTEIGISYTKRFR